MIPQPQTPQVCRKGDDAPDLTPWYDLPEAAQLLRQCGRNEPDTKRHFATFAMTRDEWTSYDRADERVARLHDIRVAHLDPLLSDRIHWKEWSIAGGLDIEVDAAIAMAVALREREMPAHIIAADKLAQRVGITIPQAMARMKRRAA